MRRRRVRSICNLHCWKAVNALQVLLNPISLEPLFCYTRRRVISAPGCELAFSSFQTSEPIVQNWPVRKETIQGDAKAARLLRYLDHTLMFENRERGTYGANFVDINDNRTAGARVTDV